VGFLTLVLIMLNKNLKTVAEVQYDKQLVYILTQHLFSECIHSILVFLQMFQNIILYLFLFIDLYTYIFL